MASYGSAIVLCGIIAAFAVHQVFRWLQKRADLHGIETRRYRALLARQTPGHCHNRGFRLDHRDVHHRPPRPSLGSTCGSFRRTISLRRRSSSRRGWSLRSSTTSSTSTAGGWHRRPGPTSTTGSSGCSRSRHAMSSGSSPSSWSPSRTQRCRAASSSTTPCRMSGWRSGSRSRPHYGSGITRVMILIEVGCEAAARSKYVRLLP